MATTRGFREAAAARVYARELDPRGAPLAKCRADLAWRELAEDDADLAPLFRVTHAGTPDRVLRDAAEATEAQLAPIECHHALEHAATRRLACRLSSDEAGLLILGRERPPCGDPENDWILT